MIFIFAVGSGMFLGAIANEFFKPTSHLDSIIFVIGGVIILNMFYLRSGNG